MKSGYYVSMIRARRVALLAGPFATHDAALAMVDPARRMACELDPWADFDSFGTLKRTPADKIGVLNDWLAAEGLTGR